MIDYEKIQNQTFIDDRNGAFWNELCGSKLAKSIGIKDFSESSLRKYDEYFFSFYPYLKKYLNLVPIESKVLEIGLGYGSISNYLANNCKKYYALDIAKGPVDCVNMRLKFLKKEQTAMVGTAHRLDFDNQSLDAVVSIGCFHHTGQTQHCIDEAYRVLKKGGLLIFMCYNKKSIRILKKFPFSIFFNSQEGIRLTSDQAKLYDSNKQSQGAPFTELNSAIQYKKMCSNFEKVTVEKENWDGRLRNKMLNFMAKTLGLDLYVICRK